MYTHTRKGSGGEAVETTTHVDVDACIDSCQHALQKKNGGPSVREAVLHVRRCADTHLFAADHLSAKQFGDLLAAGRISVMTADDDLALLVDEEHRGNGHPGAAGLSNSNWSLWLACSSTSGLQKPLNEAEEE